MRSAESPADFSEPSMHAFPCAVALAKKFDASVYACHVITLSSLVAAAPPAAPYLYEAEYNAAQQELNTFLDLAFYKGIKAKALLSSGTLGDVLLEEVKENHIDLNRSWNAWPNRSSPFSPGIRS